MEGIQTLKGSWPWPWPCILAIRHTVVHHSSTSTYIPNFIQIEKTFCGQTDGRTDGRTFFPSNIIRSTFGSRPNEKALRETQTLHAGCSKAEPKFPPPPQTPFLEACDGQNLISWRWSLPSTTDPVWWRSMHAISSYRGNRPTNKQTHRQGWLQYTAPQLSVQCNNKKTKTTGSKQRYLADLTVK